MAETIGKPPIDHAFRSTTLRGGAADPTYAGALSFMRRRYTRDLTGVDLAILGIPLDVTVTNRPGARFGPQAIRRASAILDGDPQYPFGFDLFEELAAVDYGDVPLDLHASDIPDTEAEARATRADVHLFAGRPLHPGPPAHAKILAAGSPRSQLILGRRLETSHDLAVRRAQPTRPSIQPDGRTRRRNAGSSACAT
jgi:hypothetical protein